MTDDDLVRNYKDYSEIILAVKHGAVLPVIIESALRLAVNEGAIVRFTFNETEISINPRKIRDHILEKYNTIRESQEVANGYNR